MTTAITTKAPGRRRIALNRPERLNAINGTLQDFGLSSPIEGHSIGKGDLSFRVTQAGFNVGGTTELDGIPAAISAQGKLDPKNPDVVLSAKVESDALKKLGVDTSAFLDGPLTVVAKPMPDGSIQMVADLKDASITSRTWGSARPSGPPVPQRPKSR